MTSVACVPEGLLRSRDVALLAVPLLLLEAARNAMIGGTGQVSATSQSFAAARQTAPALSGGCRQLVLVPSQVSAVQGAPSSGQAAPALPAGCWQELLLPSHWSRVQGLVSAVQAVPAGCLRSAGHDVFVPVQVSVAWHSSTAARHTAPALPAGCWHVTLVPSHWSRVQGL